MTRECAPDKRISLPGFFGSEVGSVTLAAPVVIFTMGVRSHWKNRSRLAKGKARAVEREGDDDLERVGKGGKRGDERGKGRGGINRLSPLPLFTSSH